MKIVVNHCDEYGRSHCVDGPAILWDDGGEEWWFHGSRHREDGPAITDVSGYQAWLLNDRLHRLDGPAVTHTGGHGEWWVNGNQITTEVKQWIEENNLQSWETWGTAIKILFALRFR